MTTFKICSKVEESVREDFKQMSRESHQDISEPVTEAINDYQKHSRASPTALEYLRDSIEENE